MVCKNCNHEIDNGAMFCTYCGTPVEQTPEPETQPVENAFITGIGSLRAPS